MKFTVGRKLWTGFLSLLLLMFIVGGAGFWSLKTMNDEYRFLIDERVKKASMLEELLATQLEMSNDVRGYLLYKKVIYLKNREQLSDSITQQLKELNNFSTTANGQVLLDTLKEANDAYMTLTDSVISLFNHARDDEAIELAGEAAQQQKIIANTIAELIDFQRTEMAVTEENLQKLVGMTHIVIYGLIAVAVLLSVAVAFGISRSITRPVGQMSKALTEIANGNLSIESVKIRNKDEIGEMAKAFNEMTLDLRGIIVSANESAVQLAVQAEELSASSEESLASSEMVAEIAERNLAGSESQVTIVNETVVAMEEMVTGIDQIAKDNEAMLVSSEDVSRLVGEGSTLMEEVTGQMTIINQTIGQSATMISEMANYSEEIRKVTVLITDIAEQTNLLALNAAIEAARAGEHGKGFAVVAEEVRHLAEQSKESVKEIGQMIDTMIGSVSHAVTSAEDGNRRVEEGLVITGRARDVFNQIEQVAEEVGERVATVSAAVEQVRNMTNEVTAGSAEVQELAMQSSEEAQSTSAATEQQLAANQEISSSAQVLAELAEKLQNDMGRFKVE